MVFSVVSVGLNFVFRVLGTQSVERRLSTRARAWLYTAGVVQVKSSTIEKKRDHTSLLAFFTSEREKTHTHTHAGPAQRYEGSFKLENNFFFYLLFWGQWGRPKTTEGFMTMTLVDKQTDKQTLQHNRHESVSTYTHFAPRKVQVRC